MANSGNSMTIAPPPVPTMNRHVAVVGTYNMRDIGGYHAAGSRVTRWRTLLRADALHRLDDTSHQSLREIGVRTVVDLRSDEEVRRSPNQLGALPVLTVRHPLFGRREQTVTLGAPPRSLLEMYTHVAEERPQALAGAVRELARDDALPAIVHCTIGKDRTGMVIATVLSLLGVDDDVIAADFAETESYLCGAFRDELVARHSEAGLSAHEVDAMLSVDPAFILGFLDRIRTRHRDVATFLGRHGVTDDELVACSDRLLVERSLAIPEGLPRS